MSKMVDFDRALPLNDRFGELRPSLVGRLASIAINGGRAPDAFCMSQCAASSGQSTAVPRSSTMRLQRT